MHGRQPLLVHVERASDILQVLSLKRQYPDLHVILAGASEGWMVAPQIAAAHVPVIWATQVLEEMVKSGLPTRGEMTDAAMTSGVLDRS